MGPGRYRELRNTSYGDEPENNPIRSSFSSKTMTEKATNKIRGLKPSLV